MSAPSMSLRDVHLRNWETQLPLGCRMGDSEDGRVTGITVSKSLGTVGLPRPWRDQVFNAGTQATQHRSGKMKLEILFVIILKKISSYLIFKDLISRVTTEYLSVQLYAFTYNFK